MRRVTILQIMLLSAWLGAAILVAAVLAPAAFRVLPTRTLAGAIVGAVLPVVFVSGLVLAIVVGLLSVRQQGHLRLAIIGPLAAMMIACGTAQFAVGPR